MPHSRAGIRIGATLLLFALSAFILACGSDPAPRTEREARSTATPRARSVSVSTSSNDHSAAAASSTTSNEAADSHEAAATDDAHAAADDSHETAATDDSHDATVADDSHETTASDDGHAATDDAHADADDSHDADSEKSESHGAAPHWEYTGPTGIVNWADLDESFNTCVDGGAQSPIDIRQAVARDLLNLSFHYAPARISLVNNGHTIQANFIGGSPGTMTHAGKVYNLLQFHFHRPSEHTVNGYQYAMEAHLVHQAADGSLGVVGILIEPGDSNHAFDQVWAELPAESGDTVEISSMFDVESILPEVQTTYRYPGSLTTPPCSEGVQWLLMSESVEVPQSDIDAFRNLHFFNARYTQPINGRTIVLDNSAAE